MAKRRKVLHCASVVPGCNFVAHAEDENEMMAVIAEDARGVHDVDRLSDDFKARSAPPSRTVEWMRLS
jgi:predicted small metal-binding protein